MNEAVKVLKLYKKERGVSFDKLVVDLIQL